MTATRSPAPATPWRAGSTTPRGRRPSIEDAILPYVVASDAQLVDGRVVGDPTEGALLVLAHKAGLDIDATRERLPRLATLPFDPTYKLMATFHAVTDTDGRPVVRCFVKGAAPAVMARAATALSADGLVPWDADAQERAQAHVERMGHAGRRVMAAAMRDLDPAAFDPDGDLLRYVTDLQMTSLVGMVDPPREASKAAVAARPGRAHPGPHGHRRRRASPAPRSPSSSGIPGECDPRARSSPRCPRTSGWPGSTASASSAGSRPSTRCCWSRP